jgi:hypothetical protein
MKGTSEFAVGEKDDELIERWFEQSDWAAAPEVDPDDELFETSEPRARRPGVGMVIGAVSAAAFALVLIVAIRI